MEKKSRQGWLVAAFGQRPRGSAKYRLPFSLILLVSFIGIVVFSADRGLDDLALIALVIFFVCNAVGDGVWPTSVKAATWTRIAGAGSLLAGAVAALTHLYVEQNWIFLVLALLIISAAIIFWVQDLGKRIQGSSKDSTSK